MEIKQVFVVGAGVMGRGIAQAAACAGYTVGLMDLAEDALKSAGDSIEWSLSKLEQKGKLGETPKEIMGRISYSTALNPAEKADLIIEAASENLQVKTQLLQALHEICPPETIFASNTSAIPITVLGAACGRRDKMVGIHFFNPVPMMRLAEIISGQDTSSATLDTAKAFVISLGKEYCAVKKDVAGFVMNRIGICSAIEAIRILEEGIATAEEIDKGMRLAYGWAMGPIETFDLSGLDVALHAATAIYEESGDTKFLPPVTLRRLVSSGNLGRKTGKGFYDYTK